MSSNKKIRNRLNKLFDEIKETDQADAPAGARKSSARKGTPKRTADSKKGKRPALTDPSLIITQGNKESPSTLSVPFRAGENWNVIELAEGDHRHWNEDDQNLVTQVTDQLTLALQNAYLFEQTRKSAEQLESVAEISSRISTILNLDILLKTVVQLTREKFDLYHAHIFLLDADGHTLSARACGWDQVKAPPDHTHSIDVDQPVSIVARAARSHQTVVDNDVSADPNWLPNPTLPDVKAEMAIPVLSGEEVLGVLNVHSNRLNSFLPSDLAIMTTLAAQIGAAVQNALLFRETQRSAEEMSLVNTVVSEAASTLDLQQTLSSVLRRLATALNLPEAFVALFDPVGALRIVGEVGSAKGGVTMIDQELPEDAPLLRDVIEFHRTVVVSDFSARSLPNALKRIVNIQKTQMLTILPILAQDEVIGLIGLHINEPGRTLTSDELRLTETIIAQVSIAIQNSRLFQDSQRRNTELGILNELGSELARLLDIDQICEAVYHYTSNLMETPVFYLALYDQEQETLEFPVYVKDKKRHQALPQPLGNGLSAYVIRNNKALFLPNRVTERMKELKLSVQTLPDDRGLLQCWLGVPLSIGGRVLGIIAVQSVETANLYTARHLDLLLAVANQAATSIQNTKLFEQTQKRAAELSTLNEIARATTQQLNLSQVLDAAYQHISKAVETDAILVAFYDQKTNTISYPLVIDDNVRYEQAPETLDKKSFVGKVVLSGEATLKLVSEQEYTKFSNGTKTIGNLKKVPKSLIYVPLSVGKTIVGVLSVQSYRLHAYNEQTLELLKTIANQLAVSIQNANLFAETQRYADEQSLINRIVTSMAGSLDLNKNLQTVADEIANTLKADHVGITAIDKEQNRLILIADAPAPPGGSPDLGLSIPIKGNLSTEKVFETHKPLYITDVNTDPLTEAIRDVLAIRGTKQLLIMPMMAGSEMIGTIGIDIADQQRRLTDYEIHLVERIMVQAATAVQNSYLYAQVQTSEERFRQIAETVNEVFWITDPSKNEYLYVSPAYEKVWGRSAESLYEDPASYVETIHEEDRPRVIAETPKQVQGEYDIEYRVVRPDGSVRWVRDRAFPVQNEAGDVFRVTGIAEDITERKLAEQVLMETEERLRLIVATVPVPILISSEKEGTVLFANEQLGQTFGLPLDELIGSQTPDFYVHQSDRKPLLEKLKKEGILRDYELEVKKVDGTPMWMLFSMQPLTFAGQSALLSAFYDVTERKQAEEALRTSETQLSEALDIAKLANWEYNIEKDLFTFNDHFYSIFHTTAEEQGGYEMSLADYSERLVYPDDLPIFGAAVEKALASEEHHYSAQLEHRILFTDGGIGHILVNIHVERDEKGKITRYYGADQDITERKLVEEALQRNEAALRRQNEYLATATEVGRLITSTLDLPTLFDRTVNLIQQRFGYYHVAIFTTEESGFNAILREATGEAGREMKDRQHSLTVGSKSVVGYVTGNARTLVVNNTAIDPIHRPNPSLPETRAEAGIPLKIGSRIIGALDIQATEVNAFHEEDIAVLETLADQIAVAIDNGRSYDLAQKAVAEMRELDRLKSQFLANMSHELRTPLNSIIGFSRVIIKGIDGPVTEQQNQDLSAIYNSGQHLLGLINDILDLSKIDAGKMELALEELNIADTIQSVMSTAVGLVKDKPVRLKQELDPNLPAVRADPMRIRQVLLNLIANAAKFTEEGTISVVAEKHTDSSGQQEVLISVTDSGPGISEEDQKKLFQPFSQVDSSPTRKTGGTGLGLSISHRLVEMHGGQIGVHSSAGKGSTFYFTIPFFDQPPAHELVEPGQKVILCIDDDPQVISLYERYLKPQGFKVLPVTNPASAKDAAQRIKPYAITLDIMMPDIDGWTVLEGIKADPDTRDIPIIICSIVEDEEKGFSLGAADYLVKPILEDDLIDALNRLNADGSIKDVLIIDDSPDDLRLIEKIISERSSYHPIIAEGGRAGWDKLTSEKPNAVILDLFMPDVDGFTILEHLRASPELRDLPVVVVSGADLTPEQKEQLDSFGQRLLQKSKLNEEELFATLEKALKRLESKQ